MKKHFFLICLTNCLLRKKYFLPTLSFVFKKRITLILHKGLPECHEYLRRVPVTCNSQYWNRLVKMS